MKTNLLNRIINQELQKYIFFPLDFGFYKSPTKDLQNIDLLLNNLAATRLGIPMLHKGLINSHHKLLTENKLPFFMHIT